MTCDNVDPVEKNLRFFLRTLAGFACCRTAELGEGGFAVATGTDSASENWAFVPGTPDWARAARARDFFAEQRLPFVWPLFTPLMDDSALIKAGLRCAGTLTAMTYQLDRVGAGTHGMDGLSFHVADSPAAASCWAEAAWHAFGSEEDAPASFVAMARCAAACGLLSLVMAKVGDGDAGTFMLVPHADACGIYYFAVMPELRRHGIAGLMMAEIVSRAVAAGKLMLALQATPAGRSFYLRAGFAELRSIPLYSTSDDVF